MLRGADWVHLACHADLEQVTSRNRLIESISWGSGSTVPPTPTTLSGFEDLELVTSRHRPTHTVAMVAQWG